MKTTNPTLIALIAGGLAAIAAFALNAGAHAKPQFDETAQLETAIFAGGCFWCVESDFDKVDGVVETISGYTGGDTENPTYRNHSAGGHYEAVKVIFDAETISYDELVTYFFRHIDPIDDGGQFCDRGHSYRTAVFTASTEQRGAAVAEITAIDTSGVLPAPIVTQVLDAEAFYPAEAYHQDYYLKNNLKYKYYRQGCGRDRRLEELWGDKGSS